MDLIIKLTGAVESSNLQEYKKEIMTVIDGIKTDLQTDKDFGEAEKAAKQCGAAEKAIVSAKKEALDQTKSIAELFDAMDDISAKLRDTRLTLQRQIKDRKSEIKSEMVTSEIDRLKSMVDDDYSHKAALKFFKPEPNGYELAIKGKKSIESMRDALADETDAQYENFAELNKLVLKNGESMQVYQADNPSLFADIDRLLVMETDQMQEIAETRIAKFAAEQEAKRLKEEAANKEAKQEAKPVEEKKTEPVHDMEIPGGTTETYKFVVVMSCLKEKAIEISQAVAERLQEFGDDVASMDLSK